MVLKDASAYNVQFFGGQARLIDTLSFEIRRDGTPWVAYGQFCRHFLAPLALAAYVDPRLIGMLRVHLDGVPLDLAARMLPRRAGWNLELRTHLVWHAKATVQVRAGATSGSQHFSKNALLGLLDSLERCVNGLRLKPKRTVWSDYYDATNYSDEAMDAKAGLIDRMLRSIQPPPQLVWDLGANTGRFSAIAGGLGATTVAWDVDHGAVEAHWRSLRDSDRTSCLPLVQDLTNPSPALGWAHSERDSMLGRGPADVTLALALVHHLAIGNNVPLPMLAGFLSQCCRWLIVEFVPKCDSQVQRMLSTREDVFPNYSAEGFSEAFSRFFETERSEDIPGTSRRLFLMKRIAP